MTRKNKSYDYGMVLAWIRNYKLAHNGNSPSRRQVQIGCEISSPSVVTYILRSLEKSGHVYFDEHSKVCLSEKQPKPTSPGE